MNFNLILRSLRSEKKITQAEVAKHLGISVSTYTKYETAVNQPDFYMLINLADFFNVSTDYLLGHIDVKKKSNIVKPSPLTSHEDVLLRVYRSLSEQSKGKLQERAKMLLEEELL